MQLAKLSYYLKNCFWLLVPALILDGMYRDDLPAVFQQELFWAEIPFFVAWPENILRMVVFMLPVFMPFKFETGMQKVGFGLYVTGSLLYFASWALLILAPNSEWSLSMLGFLAPAYTPFVWILGIALIGDNLFWPQRGYKPWMYILLTIIFLCFHIAHASLVYSRYY